MSVEFFAPGSRASTHRILPLTGTSRVVDLRMVEDIQLMEGGNSTAQIIPAYHDTIDSTVIAVKKESQVSATLTV